VAAEIDAQWVPTLAYERTADEHRYERHSVVALWARGEIADYRPWDRTRLMRDGDSSRPFEHREALSGLLSLERNDIALTLASRQIPLVFVAFPRRSLSSWCRMWKGTYLLAISASLSDVGMLYQ
jgi:hypothetical protein